MLWFIGVLIILLALIYILLFTQIGNNLLKPLVQSEINKYSPIELEVQKFSLRPSNFNISLKHKDVIFARLNGIFSLFSQRIDAKLNIAFNDLSVLNKSVEMPLKGAFKINSSIQGKFQDFLFQAKSNIADSKTKIEARLVKFSLAGFKADIQDLELQNLLPIIGQKSYANGFLKIRADIKENASKGYDGKIVAVIQDGTINQNLIKNDFKIVIPKTNFLFNLQADFKDKLIENHLNLTSDVGSLISSGTIQIPDLNIENIYKLSFSDLTPLTPLLKIPLRGTLESEGKIKGDKKFFAIEGKSNIANSQSLYRVSLKNFELEKVDFDVKKLSANKILWMFYQPEYAKGYADFKGNIDDFKNAPSLKVMGKINGVILNAPIKKYFGLNMPDTNFDAKIGIFSKNGAGKLDFDFDSPLGWIKFKQADFKISEPFFDGNYVVSLPDLKKLKFITGVDLAGHFDFNGQIRYSKNLHLDFYSDTFGGDIRGLLENTQLKGDFKGIEIKRIFGLFEMPQVFDTMASGNFNYDFFSQKGKIFASFEKGAIVPNDFTNMLKKYTKFDITHQVFETGNFSSSIEKKVLNAKFNMQSKQVHIDSEHTKIDLGKNKISSKIKLSLKDDYVNVNLNGNLNSPQIQIDAGALLKKQAIQSIDKGAKDVIRKYIPKKDQENAKRLLEGVLKNF